MVLGRVLDGRTGRPIPAFTVQVTHSPRRQPDYPSGGIRSDLINPGQVFRSDEGRFRVGDLILGKQ